MSAPFRSSSFATRFKPFCAAVMSSVLPWSSRSPLTFSSPEQCILQEERRAKRGEQG
jgi:hypothetical protein